MKSFITDDFLLTTKYARILYHEYAENASICDYHTHLDPSAIADNKPFTSIVNLWLGSDHYKWRLMRACGIDEVYITGNADEFDKFCKWAECIHLAVGNPIYHWTALELARFFHIDEMLGPHNARAIYDACQNTLQTSPLTPQVILQRCDVTHLCTTDDPTDSLLHHRNLRTDKKLTCTILPTFRPDMAFQITSHNFVPWLNTLAEVSGFDTSTYAGLQQALVARMNFFAQMGCKASDHAISHFKYMHADVHEIECIYAKALRKEALSPHEVAAYQSALLTFLASEYAHRDWVMQLHMGVLRNINSVMFQKLGKDSGFDAMDDYPFAEELAQFFDALEQRNSLPKTIVYTIDPSKYAQLITVLLSFNRSVRGKMQLGPAWWFNDSWNGILKHLLEYSSLGVLGTFVGMVTDSRSFLSMVRHEYFRRILCDIVGRWMNEGQLPNDINAIGNIVRAICYENAMEYFGFE